MRNTDGEDRFVLIDDIHCDGMNIDIYCSDKIEKNTLNRDGMIRTTLYKQTPLIVEFPKNANSEERVTLIAFAIMLDNSISS